MKIPNLSYKSIMLLIYIWLHPDVPLSRINQITGASADEYINHILEPLYVHKLVYTTYKIGTNDPTIHITEIGKTALLIPVILLIGFIIKLII